MEKPKPSEEHKKLEKLAGKWIGEEKIQGSPHATVTEATGTFDFRMDLGGLFIVTDYVEKSAETTLLAGHGVIGWDAKKKNYTLHWFDTFGSPPGAPGTGQWEGDALKFHQEGSGNTIFELADGGLIFKIEMDTDGKGMKPIIVGKYRRAGSRGKTSEEDQPELDRMTSRS
ncbi:MAG: DUF1579 domain-containing protein [Chloroflexota bacterium]|nr:DUF1579 domain-containing protein [Chloroflexota bacterium]